MKEAKDAVNAAMENLGEKSEVENVIKYALKYL
jgi:hypothetical protein